MSTQTQARLNPRWLIWGLRIAFFVALLTISARIRITIPGTPIPITMQTLAVLLTGMILGPVQGASAALSYVGLIALGAPLDTNGLGTAALISPTAGYLIGFAPAAFIAGLAWRVKGWRGFGLSFGLGLIGVAVLFTFGWLGLLPVMGGSPSAALMAGVIPFVFVDFGKALLAAALVKLGRESWLRWFTPPLA
ncbi:MAG: biotin transporter BioY [Anaerolinea sp.]|nr:biotin transporter BioY [Anaerolinea sp.]